MTRISDGSIEREAAQLASQSAASTHKRAEGLQRRVDTLETLLANALARLDALEAAQKGEPAESYSPLLTMRVAEVV
jgi:hypothetical protein